jgi:L-lactate dehydrogenase (cytochrome)
MPSIQTVDDAVLPLYGLGAAGERGVDRVLEWFAADVARTTSLLGAGIVADLERDLQDC